jgi:hypothetical protein
MSSDMRPSCLLWSSGVASWFGVPGEGCPGGATVTGERFPLSMFSKWLRREDTGFYACCELPFHSLGRLPSLTMDEPSVLSSVWRSMLLTSSFSQHQDQLYRCSSTAHKHFPLSVVSNLEEYRTRATEGRVVRSNVGGEAEVERAS